MPTPPSDAMMPTPRVAFFTDSYDEANGIARLSRELEDYVVRRDVPFLCVHGGATNSLSTPGPRRRMQLRRGAAAWRLEHDLWFDPLMWRHYGRVRDVVRAFQPDVVHITGPSDVGQLGACLGHRLGIPIVGSWHTNVHQYVGLRSGKWLHWLSDSFQSAARGWVERQVLRGAVLFYQVPRVLLAPNEDLVRLLADRTRRPTYLMRHGVDTELFSPDKRSKARSGGRVRIGFVGRLSAEKHVRFLETLERALDDAGIPSRFVVVGDGAERGWLQRHLWHPECPGVLTGEPLARAYANMDLFVFPSASETFGLVVLEAMASGVPVVAMAQGGPKYVVETGITGWLARDDDDFVAATVRLARDPALRCQLGRTARIRARAWSWDSVFDELYEVYGAALADVPTVSMAVPAGAR